MTPQGGTATDGPHGAGLRTSGTGAVVCAITGDLDLDGLGAVRPLLEQAVRSGANRLVIDLTDLGFCDSSGLNLLLAARLDAEKAGLGVRLAAPTQQLLRLLEITGADTVFTIDTTVDAALTAP
ncbi:MULTISPECIES: STAS domain-containing protein [unclassified Streptomyces]|uniref:STAS domain-containing protein n=1 Tax=unclassified Streptomyces TaxID=2593676 RepID=UPI002E30EBEC|nr:MULTISPECIES: STAS domain-containing protein [unclassified Streptomyces]WUC67838.1 STAS domain-containing protein [Streptomyces sp. NBC_00539]